MSRNTVLPLRVYLNGPMSSGKGVIAAQFVALGWKEVSYSDAVKDMVAAKNCITRAKLDLDKGRYRSELQFVGHTLRQADPLYWILERECRAALDSRTVESGLRYANEAEDALERGGVVIRIDTPLEVRRERYKARTGCYPTPEQENHPSETATVPFSFSMAGTLPVDTILPKIAELYGQWLEWGCLVVR